MNRADVRTAIREILRDFYDTDAVATGGIDSSSETLPVDNPTRYAVGQVIQVGSELMIVRSANSEDSELTVTRAAKESTAAAHIAAVVIKIFPEYFDRALNQAIDLAVGDTFSSKDGGIWIETIDETLSSVLDQREYSIPAGLTTIDRIQIQDTNNNYQEDRNWDLIGTKIQFMKELQDAGKTIRLVGTAHQALIADDTTEYSLGDEQMQYIWYDGAWHALQQRFAHRIRATEYSASVNDRAGQPFDLINMANNLRKTVEQIRNREFKGRMPYYSQRIRRS